MAAEGSGWPGEAGWTNVLGEDHSVGAGSGAPLGMVGCQSDAGQAGFAHVAEVYVAGSVSAPGSSPCLHFASFVGNIVSGCFPFPPPPWPSVS